MNAIFYQNRTGCPWAYLPHDLPQKSATYYSFALWRDDGTDQVIHDLLRCDARQRAGRAEDPTAIVLDTQSLRAANHVPAATTGRDAAKKVPGRKRGLAVDVLGLIIAVVATAVVVTAASATDNQIGTRWLDKVVGQGRWTRLLDKVVAHTPTVTTAWVDAGFTDDVAIHGALQGIDVVQVKRTDTRPGFVPVPERWVVEQTVEQTNGTLMLHRRLTREYDASTSSPQSHTLWASTANLVRRLTGTTTPTWRTGQPRPAAWTWPGSGRRSPNENGPLPPPCTGCRAPATGADRRPDRPAGTR